jgi:hypothetical protein
MESAPVGYPGPAEQLGASGSGGPAPAGPQAAQRPDSTNSLLTSNGVVEVLPNWSRSVYDPIGGASRRADYRQALCAFAAAIPFRRGVMITLTVDRRQFTCPEEAHRIMSPKVPDLMRLTLGVGAHWMRVLEFQSKTGDGWPHYHIVAWMPSGATLRSVRQDCWRLWRSKWGVGGCDVVPVRSGKACALYLSKYFTKAVRAVPPWQLERLRSSRLFGASWAASQFRPSRRVYRAPRPRHVSLEDPSKPFTPPNRRRRKASPRTLVDRLAWSGVTVRLRRLTIDRSTGELVSRWLPRRVVASFSALTASPEALPVAGRRVWLPCRDGEDLEHTAQRLERAHGHEAEIDFQLNRIRLEAAWLNAPEPPINRIE